MSTHPSRPAPQTSTDRPTATYPASWGAYHPVSYPAGWQADPAGYVAEGDPRLAQADATPTGVFPTRRSIRPTPSQPEQAATAQHEQETPIQDMWRPGILRRPSMRGHPSLMQLAIGAALVLALLTALQLLALDGIYSARQAAIEQGRASAQPSAQPSALAPDSSSDISSADDSANTAPAINAQPTWVTHDTGAAYDRTDPTASPLDLPRCTAAQDTPMPCLAHISNDSSRVVVLEEDASLTALVLR